MQGPTPGWQLLLLVVFWVFAAYLLLPRLHRILTRLYVPGYFIGAPAPPTCLLGDPINLALLGDEAQVHDGDGSGAGWIRADDLRSRARRRRMITASADDAPATPRPRSARSTSSTASRTSPTSRRSAARPPSATTCASGALPDGWMLPGGYAVDWLAAGTFDQSVGLSLFTCQITHKIEQNTDLERDFVVETVIGADVGARRQR